MFNVKLSQGEHVSVKKYKFILMLSVCIFLQMVVLIGNPGELGQAAQSRAVKDKWQECAIATDQMFVAEVSAR